MEFSEYKLQAQKDILPRLIKAKKAIGAVHKGSRGYGYTYANINDCLATVYPALHDQGLTVSFQTANGEAYIEGQVGVAVTLFSESGYTLEGTYTYVPTAGGANKLQGAQATGSAITYAKRYALVAFLGLTLTDEDDDGALASGVKKQQTQNRPARASQTKQEPAPQPPQQSAPAYEIKTLDQLQSEGEQSAKGGVKSYQAFFEGLHKEERQMMAKAGLHDSFKAMAKEIDATF